MEFWHACTYKVNRRKIIINDNIELTVVEINRGRVLLGINAPKDISVRREEIFQTIIAEKDKNASHWPA